MTFCFFEASVLSQSPMAEADLAALIRDLKEPPFTTGLMELAETWTYESFRFICARPADLEEYPELSERVRGAFGAALHRQAEPRTATGRGRAHPYDVLFAQLPGIGEEIGKPIIIRAAIEGRQLIVELRVFGCAIGWRDEAARAMLDALQNGVALRAAPRAMRVSLQPERIEHRRVSYVDVPLARAGLVRFRSPFTVRRHGAHHAALSAVLPAMLGRVQRMAPWQSCRLRIPTENIMLGMAGVKLDPLKWDRVRWQRYTRNRGDTPVPMFGCVGDIRLTGISDSIATVLTLAETCNAGSHAALGMGWFEWLPD
jgi:hypothetical protein